MAGICLPLGLCKGTIRSLWKMVEIPTGHLTCLSPQCIMTWGNPNLYLDQPITKGWCQPYGHHVSYPMDSPPATQLGLYISLSSKPCHQPFRYWLQHWVTVGQNGKIRNRPQNNRAQHIQKYLLAQLLRYAYFFFLLFYVEFRRKLCANPFAHPNGGFTCPGPSGNRIWWTMNR